MGSDEFLDLCKKQLENTQKNILIKRMAKLILMSMLFGVAKHCKIVKL